MLPSVIQLSTVWFLPESPRWLISNDRGDEALAALTRFHGEGEETELVKLEFEEIRAAIDHEKRKYHLPSLANGGILNVTAVTGNTTWKSMVSTKGNRYRIFLVVCMGLFSQWSGNGLISYCKSSPTSPCEYLLTRQTSLE